MLNLTCVPLGTSAAPFFLKDASTFNYKETILITATRNLVSAGRGAGLNTANFDYLANAILRQAQLQTVHKLSRTAQELVVAELIEQLQKQKELPYFADMSLRPGFVKAMTSLLSQLGRSGVTPDEATLALSSWDEREENRREKDREIALLYTAYRNYLQQQHLFDVEGLYRLALASLHRKDFIPCWKHLYFYGFYKYDALQLEIIQALSKVCDVHVALVYEKNRPRIFAAVENTFMALASMGSVTWMHPDVQKDPGLSCLARNLRRENLAGVSVTPVCAHAEIELWETLDQESETARVLRAVKTRLREGVPGKDIAIIVRRLENYAGFRRLCDAYGIPTVLPQVTQLNSMPLVEYVRAFLNLGQGFGREQAVAVLDFLALPLQAYLRNLVVAPLQKLVKTVYVREASRAWEAALQAEPEAENELKWLQEKAEAVPDRGTITEYGRLTCDFLVQLQVAERAGELYKASKIDLEAFKSLVLAATALQEVCRQLADDAGSSNLEYKKITRAEFVQLLTEKGQSQSLIMENGCTVGINILAATEVQELQFPYVYLLGLREHEFPCLQTENWLYDDSERSTLRSLGVDLPGSQEGYAEDALFFAEACVTATRALVCSYAPDEQEGASPYVDDLVTLFGPEIKTGFLESVTAGELASLQEYKHFWAGQGNTTVLTPYLETGVLDAATADKLRLEKGKDSRYSGSLTESTLLSRVQMQIGNSFSASKLESYLICPFRFLYGYVWQQREENQAEENIRADVQGSLLHATLEKFMGARLETSLAATGWDTLVIALDKDFETCCTNFVEQGQIVAAEFWEADKKQLQRILHRWLRQEISYSANWTYRPWAVETDFGGDRDLTISLPEKKISVNGRIDRVDRDGHNYFVTDYKTSNAPQLQEFLQTNLQLPIYLWAAQAYLRKQDPEAMVTGGGYFVLKNAERKASIAYAGCEKQFPFKVQTKVQGDTLETLAQVQTQLHEVLLQEFAEMTKGNFVPVPGKYCNRFCPAWDVCRQALLKKAAVGED